MTTMIRVSAALAFCTLVLPLSLTGTGQAQPAARQGNAAGGGGVLSLPQGVKRVISIDAYNTLMVEVDRDGRSAYATMPVKHVYSGGIARLFGGTSIPTAQFVSPGAAGGNGGSGMNGPRMGVTGTNFGGNNQGGFGGGFGAGGGGIGGLVGAVGGGFGGVNTRTNPQVLPAVPSVTVNGQTTAIPEKVVNNTQTTNIGPGN